MASILIFFSSRNYDRLVDKKFLLNVVGCFKTSHSNNYDRIDWNHLRGVIRKIGISHQWINSIIMCVEKVDYFVLPNSNATSHISLGRDLRQGDHSPYLFIICDENLMTLIQKDEMIGETNGVKICNNVLLILPSLVC